METKAAASLKTPLNLMSDICLVDVDRVHWYEGRRNDDSEERFVLLDKSSGCVEK
jgi:hypothetical protein